MKIYYSLLLLLLIVSCQKSDKQTETVTTPKPEEPSLSLQDKGIKTVSLDSLADFEDMQDPQINHIDGKQYLSFFDRDARSLYIHDYETGALDKKITLAQEGPDKVHVGFDLQYHVHSLDSILLNTAYGCFLINSEAKLLASLNSKTPSYSSGAMQISFDQSSSLSKGKIHGSITPANYKYLEHFPFVRGTLNFTTGKLTTDSIHASAIFNDYEGIIDFLERAKKKKKSHVRIQRHIMKAKDHIYATTAISDSIRIFKDQKLIGSINASLPDYEVVDYLTYFKNNEMTMSKGLVRSKQVMNHPPIYKHTLIDPQGKFIYRFISHGTKAGMAIIPDNKYGIKNPFNGTEIPVIKGATLLAINLNSGEHYQYELPIEEIDLSEPFVSNAGIHFRVKEQENEDRVQFRVFGMGKQN